MLASEMNKLASKTRDLDNGFNKQWEENESKNKRGSK